MLIIIWSIGARLWMFWDLGAVYNPCALDQIFIPKPHSILVVLRQKVNIFLRIIIFGCLWKAQNGGWSVLLLWWSILQKVQNIKKIEAGYLYLMINGRKKVKKAKWEKRKEQDGGGSAGWSILDPATHCSRPTRANLTDGKFTRNTV